MRRKVLVLVSLLVIALMLASTVPVGAKGKPPKDPPPDDGGNPTGTIYYFEIDDVDGYGVWSMDADGRNKAMVSDSVKGSISLMKHKDGHRWFIYFNKLSTNHPDGKAQTELWAIRDDGTGSIKLWSDPSMVYMGWNGPICWMTGDAFISWVTWKIAADGTITNAGIYKATMAFGADDNTPSVGTPVLVYDTGSYYFDVSNAEYRAAGTGPNWSADMNKVVYYDLNNGKTVVDISTTPVTKTIIGGNGWAMFSPDGNKLACAIDNKLHVMDTDGTDDTAIVTLRSNSRISKNVRNVRWSPDSEFLVFTDMSSKVSTGDSSADVYTVGVDGSSKTRVTRSTPTCDWHYSMDWR